MTRKILIVFVLTTLMWTTQLHSAQDEPLSVPRASALEVWPTLAGGSELHWEKAVQEALPAPTTTAATTTAPAPVYHAAPAVAPAPAPGSNYERFERLADCETGRRERRDGHWYFYPGTANWAANTGNGYYGGLQFSADTWHRAGGTGLPHQHTKDEQISVAESWLARTSWGQWPECSKDLGYH